MHLAKVPYTNNTTPTENIDFETRLRLFGYTIEDLKTIINPMSTKGTGSSMGNDTPLAVLSDRPRIIILNNYSLKSPIRL
jgi:glutamate synthase (ferredoxin)